MATRKPNATAPLAPPSPAIPGGSEPPASADESAMLAGLGAGPSAGPAEHAAMTKPSHNIKKAPMPPYGPATNAGPAGPV